MLTTLLVVAGTLFALAVAARTAEASLVVSLTFDDALADQVDGAAILASAGLPATFFVISGTLGQPGHLTAADLVALTAAGNEIGGHTVDHADLPALDPAAQRHELCDDRRALLALGIQANVVAYPYGHYDASAQAIARDCGYVAARQSGGLAAPGGCSGPCPPTETLPPGDPFAIRSAASLKLGVGLAELQKLVLAGEAAGGWLILTFHHICSGCSPYSTDPSVLRDFAGWLAPRAAQGTIVRTMSQALAEPPAASAPPAPAPVPAAAPLPAPATPAPPARCRPTRSGVRAGRWPATTHHTSIVRCSATRCSARPSARRSAGRCSRRARRAARSPSA